jgi:hypothetical protein
VTQTVTDADIYSIAYGTIGTTGYYVFVTDYNDSVTYESQIVYSTNAGTTWTAVANNPVNTYKIDSIVSTGGNFAIFANNGFVSYTNSSITSWATAFRVNTGAGLNNNHYKMAAVGNGVIIATSRYGYAYASTSSLGTWSWQDVYPSATYTTHVWLNCVVFDGTRFFMAGQDGGMAYTVNGASFAADPNFNNANLSWTKAAYVGYYINGIAYSPALDLYVASGGDSIAIGEYAAGFAAK